MKRLFDDIGSRREDEAIKADLKRRHAKLKNDIRSLPPRERATTRRRLGVPRTGSVGNRNGRARGGATQAW